MPETPIKALIIVDLQRDFLPGGAWELSDSEAVVPLVNRLQSRFKTVAAVQDWHPRSHKIFCVNHDHREIGQVIPFKKQTFTLTRMHCVQKTPGAELAPGLQRDFIHKIFQRGMDSDVNGYSAFFDNDHRSSTGLTEFLRERMVTDVYIAGFSPDGGVFQTALDAQALGFNTWLIEDAVRTAPMLETEKAERRDSLSNLSVRFISSREII